MYQDVAILALFAFAYSTVGAGIERTLVSGPIVFTLFGAAVGPLGLDLLSLHANQDDVRTLAEFTLALVLFTDASKADLPVLRRSLRLPQRLLLLGLPLTIVLGAAVGRLLFEKASWLEFNAINLARNSLLSRKIMTVFWTTKELQMPDKPVSASTDQRTLLKVI